MELTIYDGLNGRLQQVNITTFTDLCTLIEVYFDILESDQIIEFQNIKIDISKTLEYYKLKDGDLLTISELPKQFDNVNALNNYTNDMMLQAQVTHTLCYIKGEYNDIAFKIMIDSGAQSSVMSNHLAKLLDIHHNIDTNMAAMARGIGSAKILGCIYGCNIKFNGTMFMPVNLKILDNPPDDFSKNIILFGLDFLYTYKCNINFKNRTLEVNNEIINFMNESEVNKYEKPFNIKKDNILTHYNVMNNALSLNQRYNVNELLKKIITNIIKYPHDDKYKSINLENKTFKENLSKYQECLIFMKNIGFKETTDGKLKFTNDIDMLNYTQEILV